jgi:hypothetical protein
MLGPELTASWRRQVSQGRKYPRRLRILGFS